MNGQFLQWFALGIAFWATVNYLIEMFLSRREKRRQEAFKQKVDRYRSGHR